jgi:hypothetical protein
MKQDRDNDVPRLQAHLSISNNTLHYDLAKSSSTFIQPLDRVYGEPSRYRASVLFLASWTLQSVAKSVFCCLSILHYYYGDHHTTHPPYTWCSANIYGTWSTLHKPQEGLRPQKNADACSHSRCQLQT